MLSNADSFALKVVLFFRLFLSQNRIVVIHGQVTVRQYAFCRKIAVTTHDKSLRIGHRCYRILMACQGLLTILRVLAIMSVASLWNVYPFIPIVDIRSVNSVASLLV